MTTPTKVCDLTDGYALHSRDGFPAIMSQRGNTFICSALEVSRLALDRATREEWHRRVNAWLGANLHLHAADDPRWRAAAHAEHVWRTLWDIGPGPDGQTSSLGTEPEPREDN